MDAVITPRFCNQLKAEKTWLAFLPKVEHFSS